MPAAFAKPVQRVKPATIVDVARKAGVSKSTVSAVVNGTRRVTDETSARVLEAVRELNYKPSPSARLRKSVSAPAIGLLIKEMGNPFYGEIMMGAHRVAREAGYLLHVASSEGLLEEESRLIDDLRHRGICGLIISPLLSEQADLSNLFVLSQAQFPFVLLEKIFGVQANIVDIDNVAASKRAVQHLIQEGHTRVAHFAGPFYSMHSRERVEGVRQAFSESHLIFRDDTVVTAGASYDDGYAAALAYFEGHADDRPTAVTCFNDLVALGVWKAVSDLGLDVPDDVSIIGYDDIEMLRYLPHQLSTVRGQNRRMGEIAAEVLIRHIEAERRLPIERIYLETELILRESTRSLAGSFESVANGGDSAS